MAATFAMNRFNYNQRMLAKHSKRVASGFKINSAADNAAGLAVSEKMRSQVRGYGQAKNNTLDAISLLQVAEGGLNETHAILQRMREIAVQSSNGTNLDDTDREALSLEFNELKKEITRISGSTEYNKINLLGGKNDSSVLASSGASSSNSAAGVFNIYGPNYSSLNDSAAVKNALGTSVAIASNTANTIVKFDLGASGTNAEFAEWKADGTLNISLNKGTYYTDAKINELIGGALQEKGMTTAPSNVIFASELGGVRADGNVTLAPTAAGTRTVHTLDLTDPSLSVKLISPSGTVGNMEGIRLTANTYGARADHEMNGLVEQYIYFSVDKDYAGGMTPGNERVEMSPDGKDAWILLSTGTEYTEDRLQEILKSAGLDYTVEFYDSTAPHAPQAPKSTIIFTDTSVYMPAAKGVGIVDGSGVGKNWFPQYAGTDTSDGYSETLKFQIGANGTQDQTMETGLTNMSSEALGLSGIDVDTQDNAANAINALDAAIKKTSLKRAYFGAQTNRLEYTFNNLTTSQENITEAESRIRDADMAEEMIEYTKYSILAQAAQAMMAQEMQSAQLVLKLLGG
ncbi:MAG: flagellar hook protein [Oscillospiraceae bacterium]|jgi:flagellin|nr:flagellar hook protein [Oscillospiraceae bacterium]